MKILHVISTLDPRFGGPPKVAMSLAAAQRALGHDVTVASAETDARMPSVRQLQLQIPGGKAVKHVQLPCGNAISRYIASTERRLLRPAIKTADIVHLHNVWERMLHVAGAECRAAAKPYMILFHGMLDPWSLSQGRWKKSLAMAMGVRKWINHAAALHMLNEQEQSLIAPLRFTPPCVVIPNGVFPQEVADLPQPGTFRASQLRLADRPYILFLSRLHYKKGLDFLADAFQRVTKTHPNVMLVVAGPDDGARTDFEQRIAAMDLSERVIVPGPLYGRDKFAALVDAACFCLPSRQEGFSMAITEAMACGLPVVITEGCHFPEVAQSGAGKVVPLNVERIADALSQVLGDDTAGRRMGDAGRELVAARFTWPRIAERSVAAYEDILRRNA